MANNKIIKAVLNLLISFTTEELDHLHDAGSNSIGTLLLHLGATEKYYQINTFEGRQEFNEEELKIWGPAMNLGDEGRANIKGHNVKYYFDIITEVRQKTLTELKTRDDDWLLAVDPEWSKEEPFNTYWKWFHVCEHEANHRGQIAWLKSRFTRGKACKGLSLILKKWSLNLFEMRSQLNNSWQSLAYN